MYSANVPYQINGYGFSLSNFTHHIALKDGYVFGYGLRVTPDKRLDSRHVCLGELLISSSNIRETEELYKTEDSYITVSKTSISATENVADDDVPMPVGFGIGDQSTPALDSNQEEGETASDYKVTQVTFYHRTLEANLAFKDKIMALLEPVPVKDNQTQVSFWYNTKEGATNYSVNIDTPAWADIKGNYASSLQPDLDSLMNFKLGVNAGSIILLHGPAGTGKTYLIRALIREWKKKCQANYVIDVDQLFDKHSADYLVSMIFLPKQTQKYSLILMEDSGELLAKDAKLMMGQAMSRMLNLSDGILGQGGKTILLISTNEAITSLNEAISRPGRCFATLHFDKIPQDEAQIWLKNRGIDDTIHQAMTLAELYEIVNSKQIANKQQTRIGFVK